VLWEKLYCKYCHVTNWGK